MIPTAARQAVYDLDLKRQLTRAAVVVSPVFWEENQDDQFDDGLLDDKKWLHSEPRPSVTGGVLEIKSYGQAPFDWVLSRPLWIPAQDLSLPFEIIIDAIFPQTDPGYTQMMIVGGLDGENARRADPMRIFQLGHNKDVAGLSPGDILVEQGTQSGGTAGFSFANDQLTHEYRIIWDPRLAVPEPQVVGDMRIEVQVDTVTRLEATNPRSTASVIPFGNTVRPFYIQIGVNAEFDTDADTNAPGTPGAPVNVIEVERVRVNQHDGQGWETRVYPGWTAPGGSGLNEALDGERFEMGGEEWAKFPGIVRWNIDKGRERESDSFSLTLAGVDPDNPTDPSRFIDDRLVGRPLVIDTAVTDGSDPVSDINDPAWGELVQPSPVDVVPAGLAKQQLAISPDRAWVVNVQDGTDGGPATNTIQVYPWNEVTGEWGAEVPQDYPDPPGTGAGGARYVDFHPSGDWIVVGSVGGTSSQGHMRIYSFDRLTGEIGQLTTKYFNGTRETHTVRFSPDGDFIGRACRQRFQIFSFNEQTGVASLANEVSYGVADEPWGMSWHPSGDFVALAEEADGPSVRKIDRGAGGTIGPILKPSSGPSGSGVNSAIEFSPEGNAVVFVGTSAAQGFDVWSFTEKGPGAFLSKWTRPPTDSGIDGLAVWIWEGFFVTYDNGEDLFKIHPVDYASEEVLDPANSITVTDFNSNNGVIQATNGYIFFRRGGDPFMDALEILNPPSDDEWIRQICGIVDTAHWKTNENGYPELTLTGKDRPATILNVELRRTYIAEGTTTPAVNIGFSIDEVLDDLFDVASAVYEGDALRDVQRTIQYDPQMQPQQLTASGNRLAGVYTQIVDEFAMSYWKRYRTYGIARWGQVFTHRWFSGLGAESGQFTGPDIPWHHIREDDLWWEEGGGTAFNTPSSVMRLGDSGGATLGSLMVSFPLVQIPQGATITRAIVSFVAQGAGGGVTFNTTVYCNRSNNAFIPLNQAEAAALALTTGTLWSGTASWADLDYVQPPDISAEIQQVIDLPGWIDGNTIGVIIKTNSASGTFDLDITVSTEPPPEARLLLEFDNGAQYVYRGQAVAGNNVHRFDLQEQPGAGMVVVHSDGMGPTSLAFLGGIPGPGDFPGQPYPPRAAELHMSTSETGSLIGITENNTIDRRGHDRRGGMGILKWQREVALRRQIAFEVSGHDWLEPDDEIGALDPQVTGLGADETFVVDALSLNFRNDMLITRVKGTTSDLLKGVRRGI